MITIAILPDTSSCGPAAYRAIAGSRQSVGRTPGEAQDALTQQLDREDMGTMVVQNLRPDRLFTAQQQQRLAELMERWRKARDAQAPLSTADQAALNALVDAEVQAAGARAAPLAPEPTL
jgi:hypothetical protein